MATKRSVEVGDPAPDFTLPAQSGEQVRLSDVWKRGPVVLYFYPKDETPGCTTEACTFRDSYEAFKEAGAEVVGVSSDSVTSHESFASKHRLPFILLADDGGRVRKEYGVKATFGILPGRVTYVIDGEGVVRHVFSSQTGVQRHVHEALDALSEIAARA
ncbi:MAG: peroxiredoxin [Chloroflexi bacterium]|nr:MAG: peroxiredoxin [Chloroflexota bacterium]